ncbi:MAG: RAMP superfamily CRISPR-associated protein [Thermofilaceae archaeon]
MPDYRDFDKLKLLTVVEGFLVNETPLRVGVGMEPPLGSAVDIALLRISIGGRSVPYIPGSSLKGSLRSLAESIARAQGYSIHDPWDWKAIEDEKKNSDFCIICGIFGNTYLAGHVKIYDAYPVGETLLFVKTGVGISRDFRGAHPRILYTEEQVAPGVEWAFRMDIINIKLFPEPEEERGRLLKQLLELLRQGMVQVGARKALGYGLLRLTKGEYRVYEVRDGQLEVTGRGIIGGDGR